MRILHILSITLIIFSAGCKKKESSTFNNGGLPPITDTGAGTFGCMVNGNLFKPQKQIGSSAVILYCYYQELGDDKRVFTLAASDFINSKGIVFNLENIIISGDTILHYSYPGINNASARYGVVSSKQYSTHENAPGEFRITKFDRRHQIVAGTFWFDAVDTLAHDTVRVRDGRFDVHFSL